jgi:cytochrome P450
MSNLETIPWQAGISENTPLPPLVTEAERADESRFFVEQYRKLGPIFRLPHPEKPLIVMAGPEANTFVTRHEDEFFTTQEQWAAFDTTINATKINKARDGEANRQRRAKTSRSYSRARVLDQLPRMVEITQEFTQWQSGESITVVPGMQRVVAEQLGQLLVNYSVGDYLPDLVTYLNTAITNSFGMGQSSGITPSSPEFLRVQERAYELGRLILAAHRDPANANRKPDLLDDKLVEAAKQPERFPDQYLVRSCLGPFLAGLDTVANSTSFMFYALLKNPHALQRVVAEVDAAFAQGTFTWEKLKEMHALHGAAMETLRLYPVAGGHKTRVAHPFTFAGYRVEPGNDVFVAMTVPHFLPELFPQPETFDIDRYHEPRNEHRQRGAYAPFGLGDHICLGAGIAEVQLMVIPAVILHCYRLELDPLDYQLAIENDPTPSPGKQFKIRVVARR